MCLQPSLIGFVIVGRDNQNRVRTGFLGMNGKINCLVCIVGTCTGNYRYPAFCGAYTYFNNMLVFIMGKRRGFTGCASRNKTVCTLFQLPFQQVHKSLLVKRTRSIEWRYKCWHGSFKHGLLRKLNLTGRNLYLDGICRKQRTLMIRTIDSYGFRAA